jgi:hypothetical protein
MSCWWRGAFAGVGVSLVVAWAGASPANAHQNGEIELYVSALRVAPVAAGVAVSADLIDQDSGAPASGFGVRVNASADNGAVVGPVQLLESTTGPDGRGHYQAVLPLPPGKWHLTATTEQGQSALPAITGTEKSVVVLVDPNGKVSTVASGGSSQAPVLVGTGLGVIAVASVGLFLILRRRRRATSSTHDESSGVERLQTGRP